MQTNAFDFILLMNQQNGFNFVNLPPIENNYIWWALTENKQDKLVEAAIQNYSRIACKNGYHTLTTNGQWVLEES